MKIQVVSDLHLEFGPVEIPVLAKYLFIAGDLGYTRSQIYKSFIEFACGNFEKVFYVTGNHEYYTSSIYDTEYDVSLLEKKYSNFIYLHKGVIHQLEDCRVIGCTLWSHPTAKAYYMMNDGNYIQDFSVYMERGMHNEDKTWLNENITDKCIVMTHHMPSFKLIAEKYKKYDPTGFASHCDELVKRTKVWIYGHTHTASDIMLDGCRCICNPHGYPGENEYVNLTYDI